MILKVKYKSQLEKQLTRTHYPYRGHVIAAAANEPDLLPHAAPPSKLSPIHFLSFTSTYYVLSRSIDCNDTTDRLTIDVIR